MIDCMSAMTGGPMTGSLTPTAMNVGPSHCVAHHVTASREIATPGAVSSIGTNWGNFRAPAMYDGSGNGAPYPATSASVR